MFLLMTSFHKPSNDNQRPLSLLDEPASNLHSSAQAELLKSFEKLLDKCTLIYTTHSHHMINVRWLDSAFVVKNAALGSLDADLNDYFSARMGARTSSRRFAIAGSLTITPNSSLTFNPCSICSSTGHLCWSLCPMSSLLRASRTSICCAT